MGDHDCDHSDDDGGGGDGDVDGDHSDDDGDNVHLTFSSFSLPLDDGPARRQSSSLAVPPVNIIKIVIMISILVTFVIVIAT